jgi:hypothetical protein
MKVDEVILTAKCLHAVREFDYRTDCFRGFTACLTALADREESLAPLHIQLYIKEGEDGYLPEFLDHTHFPETMTCEFFDVPFGNPAGMWDLLYDLGGVIHLEANRLLERNEPLDPPDLMSSRMATAIQEVFYEDEPDSPPGHMFLCDASQLILSPAEPLSATNANDAAMLKVFSLCDFDLALMGRDTSVSRWDYFTARVKFVDAGYRPTKAEMAAISERRSVFPNSSKVMANKSQEILAGSSSF